MSRSVLHALAALAAVLVPALAGAQPAPGLITGVVRDTSGAPVPGAVVRLVNERAGSAAVAVSDEKGAYSTGALAPGAYRLETELDGFELSPGVWIAEGAALVVKLNVCGES